MMKKRKEFEPPLKSDKYEKEIFLTLNEDKQ